ncbi:MAG: Gfo/Idh/MocA family oxidoreductase [Acidimicrobiales bacterium]
MKRIGVVGAGAMGREHLKNLAEVPGVEVVVVADALIEAARRAAGQCGADATDDADGVVRDTDLDAVVIASPDETHAAFAIAAIESGLMVLCEKPLATDLRSVARIVDAEVALGHRVLQVGFMRVYDEAHRQVADELGTIGTVRQLRCVHRNANAGCLRSVDTVLTGSVIHDVHTVRWLTGDEVARVRTTSVARPGGVAFVHVVAELANGGIATIDFDDTAFGYEVTVEVNGTHGTVMTAPAPRAIVSVGGESRRHIGVDWFGRFADAYRREAFVWTASVAEGKATGPSAWDGLAAQFVVDAAVRSEHSGVSESVELPDRPALYD